MATTYSTTQKMGVYATHLPDLLKAVAREGILRTKVGNYVVMDGTGDPDFPSSGSVKKVFWGCIHGDKKGDVTFCVALRSKIDCKSFFREKRVLSLLKGSPGVIQPLLIEDKGDFSYMISKLFNRGNLLECLKSVDRPITIQQRNVIAYVVVSALLKCQEKGVIWRDGKLENILVNELADGRLEANLIDFGFAFVMQEGSEEESCRNCGSLNYLSPETWAELSHTGKFFPADYKTDLWAIGSVLFALAKGHLPGYKLIKDGDEPVGLEVFPEAECPELGIYSKVIKDLVYKGRDAQPSLEDVLVRIHNIFVKTYPESGFDLIEEELVVEKPSAKWLKETA